MTDNEKRKFLEDLQAHHCTDFYYRYMTIMITDGVKFLCETAQCFWLADCCAANQYNDKVKNESFQVYILKVNADQSARVTIEDGNGNVLDYQDYNYTDFPLDTITIWVVDKIALLPSEY